MAAFLLPVPGARGCEEPRGGGDAVWGSGDGPQFLPGSTCGPGLEEPQVRAVRVVETAPPCKGVGAAGGAGAALAWVAVEGPVRATGGVERSPRAAGLRLHLQRWRR